MSRGYGRAVQILEVEEPTDAVIDIKAAYESKHGTLGTGAPKVFFKYFFVNFATGETSVPMQVLAIFGAEATGYNTSTDNTQSGGGDNTGTGGDNSGSGGNTGGGSNNGDDDSEGI